MPMYALATIPLINRLDITVDLKQVWYADDASASGSLTRLVGQALHCKTCLWTPPQCFQGLVTNKTGTLGKSKGALPELSCEHHVQ